MPTGTETSGLTRLGEQMGIHNYREGSTVTLTADCKATKHKKVKWHIWTSIDSKETPVETDTDKYEMTFADVPDDKEYYMVRYQIEWRGKKRPGPYEFVVWPESITVAAEIKDDGRKDEAGNAAKQRFEMMVREEGKIIARGLLTDAEGKGEGFIPTVSHGRVTIAAVSPWQIDTDDTKFHRKRTLKVSRKPYKAQLFRSHDDKPAKQWVNLPVEADHPEQNNLVEIECGAWGDKEAYDNNKMGVKGDVIFCKVTFDKDNSKRSEPRPGVIVGGAGIPNVAQDGVDNVFTFKVTLGADRVGRFQIECGQAGGDKIKVEVGVTDACADDALNLVTWRAIAFNMVVPHADIRMPSDLISEDGLANPLKGQLKRVLDQLFIELRVSEVKEFTLADLKSYYGDLADGHVIMNKDYFPHITKAGTKVFVGCYDDIKNFMKHKLGTTKQPLNTFNVVFCDRMAKSDGHTPEAVSSELTKEKATFSFEIDANYQKYYQFFKYHPGKFGKKNGATLVNGFAVETIAWMATEYKDGATWKPVEAGKAGWDKKDWQIVPVTSENIDKYVTFDSAAKVTIKLPAGEAADTLMRGATPVKILLYVMFQQPNMGVNGSATPGTGQIIMTTDWGQAVPKGMSRTMTHEMGHNLGHTYFEKKDARTRGRAAGKKIPGVEFGAYVTDDPKGHYYCNNFGHVGGHCCIMPNKPALQTCENFATPTANDKNTHGNDVAKQLSDNKGCILFGSGDMSDDVHEYSYCVDCKKYIRAGNCSNVVDYQA